MAIAFSDLNNNIKGYLFEAAAYLAYRARTSTSKSPAVFVYFDFCVRGADVTMDDYAFVVSDDNMDMPHADYVLKVFRLMALARAAYHEGTLHPWFIKRLPEPEYLRWRTTSSSERDSPRSA